MESETFSSSPPVSSSLCGNCDLFRDKLTSAYAEMMEMKRDLKSTKAVNAQLIEKVQRLEALLVKAGIPSSSPSSSLSSSSVPPTASENALPVLVIKEEVREEVDDGLHSHEKTSFNVPKGEEEKAEEPPLTFLKEEDELFEISDSELLESEPETLHDYQQPEDEMELQQDQEGIDCEVPEFSESSDTELDVVGHFNEAADVVIGPESIAEDKCHDDVIKSEGKKVVKHAVKCKVCFKKFFNKAALTVHEKETRHDLRFQCEYCQWRFKQKIQLERHLEQTHGLGRDYECKLCGKKFKSEFSCRRHETNVAMHTKLARPIQECAVCGRKLARRNSWAMKLHMKTHTQEEIRAAQAKAKEFLDLK